MKFGNRASLEEIPRKFADVVDEEHDTFYRIREMSGTERDDYELGSMKRTQNGTGTPKHEVEMKFLRARLVSLCLVDETGERIYTDIQQCSALPQGILMKLFLAANKLNGLEATAVEDAVKNSASDLEDASTSSSPDTSKSPSLNS